MSDSESSSDDRTKILDESFLSKRENVLSEAEGFTEAEDISSEEEDGDPVQIKNYPIETEESSATDDEARNVVDETVQESVSLKEELIDIVKNIKEEKTLPDVIAELIQRRKLNTMIFDLYDYKTGYDLSFYEFGSDSEKCHGRYSYGIPLLEYVTDGQIPYELFDLLRDFEPFQLFYHGYMFCQLRIHFKDEESIHSHFVLLKHTIQTIDGECCMNCTKDPNLSFGIEKARLINHYSPDLCLDPNPVVADIIIANELNQRPFTTLFLKHIIHNEKARIEMGVKKMAETSNNNSVPANPKKELENDFASENPTTEEPELSKLDSSMKMKLFMVPYLKSRQICFPEKDSFDRSYVEIENFVYEHYGLTKAKKIEAIFDQLCIGVLDNTEYYYSAYKLDKRMNNWAPFDWWPVGSREDLDKYIIQITMEEKKLCRFGMKITHNRMFDKIVQFSNRRMKMVSIKLKNPVSQVILQDPLPSPQDGNEQSKIN